MSLQTDSIRSQVGAADSGVPSVTSAALPPLTDSHLPEIFFSLLVLVLVVIRVVQQHELFARLPGSDWNSSEWMIDYAAGFVRRGLSGALLATIMRLTGWSFFSIWTTITTASYLGLCSYIVTVSWRLGGPALWRFALLLNPILLLSAANNGSVARKDTLFIWGTLLNVVLGHYVLQQKATRLNARARHTLVILSAALLSALTLALVHEGIFLFTWLPLNLAVLAYILMQMRFRVGSVVLLLSLTFAPALVAVGAGAYRHGNPQTAQTICLSWHSAAIPTVCSAGDDFPPAIDALSWSLSRGTSYSRKYAWRFPAYPAVFAVAGSVEIITLLVLIPTARLEYLLVLLALPFAASLPLFLLGEDWGRWLCLLGTSSLMVMLSDQLRPSVYCFLPANLRIAIRDKVAPLIERTLGSFRRQAEHHPLVFCIALLMLPVPSTPNPAALLGNPLAIVLMFFHGLWYR
jgi:hypothetical protein